MNMIREEEMRKYANIYRHGLQELQARAGED
jgi:hypothetical protein